MSESRHDTRRLAAMAARASVGLSKISLDGRFLMVNDELCRMLGRSREVLLAARVPDVTHPDDLPATLGAFGGVVATGEPCSVDKRYLRPDGTVVEANSRLTRLDTKKGPLAVIAVTVDLTERKHNIARVEAREERLRLALAIGQLATLDWDMLTSAVSWSDEHYQMLGYRVGEIEPSLDAWAQRVHPDDVAQVSEVVLEARRTHQKYAHEFRFLHADGSVHWCAAQGRFFYNDTGRATRMIGVLQDVSARHRAEEIQRTLVDELQHRTRNLLAIVQSVANQTMRTKRSFEAFEPEFKGRLAALSRVQALLSNGGARSITLDNLVCGELIAHGADIDGRRIVVSGPAVEPSREAVQALTLALHELATNALKYGALKCPQARLEVRWELTGESERRLRICWSEYGVALGAVQTAADGGGFGRELIERALPYELGAETSFRFAEDGVRCVISLPVG